MYSSASSANAIASGAGGDGGGGDGFKSWTKVVIAPAAADAKAAIPATVLTIVLMLQPEKTPPLLLLCFACIDRPAEEAPPPCSALDARHRIDWSVVPYFECCAVYLLRTTFLELQTFCTSQLLLVTRTRTRYSLPPLLFDEIFLCRPAVRPKTPPPTPTRHTHLRASS